MKKSITILMISILMAMICTGFRATAGISDFIFTINNDIQTSDRTFEFDLYLLDTDPAQTFELATVQAGILVNPAIYNGGTITVSIVAGSSQLVPAQQPNSVLWTQSSNIIKLTPMSPTSAGLGTIISQTGIGTRVCRLLVTNTVPFTLNSQANLAFNFTTSPYPTRVAQMISTVNTQLPCSATNCYSLAANIPFNTPPTATISGSQSICTGGTATLNVALTGSAPFTYYWSDDNGATSHAVFSATNSSTFQVSPATTKTYIITSVIDNNLVTGAGTGSATVYTGPVATISSVTDLCPGSNFTVPVTVTDFDRVGSVSLTLSYNTAAMDFLSGVNTSSYPGLTFNEPQPGKIVIGGFTNLTDGITLTDNATLLTLNFSYLGGNGSITFDNTTDNNNEFSGVTPLFEPYCDAPESHYYINGSVSGDQLDPLITCPANVNVQAPAGSCFVLNPALGTPVTSDNCAVNTVTNNFTALFANGEVPIGVHTITWTVTDFNGNFATCTQTLTVTQGPNPVFNPIGPYCQNSIAPALPTTSANGITGTWAPATINTATAGTFPYVFTPGVNECSNPVTVQITIDPELTPSFNQIGSLCQNTTPPALPTSSLNGVTGTWSPSVINTTVPGTFTYTFTPAAGQCAVPATMDITIDPLVTPTFAQIGPICQFTTAPSLPLTSTNGVAGTWNPSAISTSVAGTFTYTFTPTNPYCTNTATMDIVITPSVAPTFNQIGPLCQNSIAPTLPATSTNGITGVWNPATISTAIAGTFTYTFTPDPSFCASVATMDIVINAPVLPAFTEIGSLCQNSVAPLLPTTSNNGITGTWNPAVINTTSTGTTVYTFTPNAGQCATIATMSITIDTQVTPLFAPIGPLCQNSTAPLLPLTSVNNITGTWSPSAIVTTTPGSFLFTFTPETGSCAIPTTMTIVIDQLVTPTFTQLGPYCQNSVPGTLPTISLNGVAGSWSPATISTTTAGTFTYTFTPTDPYCTTTATMSITINPSEVPVFTQIQPLCLNSTAPVLPGTSNNNIPGTWNPATISTNVAGTFEYVFTPNTVTNPCAVAVSMWITINPLPTATISGSTTTCPGVPVNLTVNLTGTAPWTYYWSDDNGVTTHLVNAATSPSTFSVSPSVTTTYIITSVQDATGCSNTGTGTATVTGDVIDPEITCPVPASSYIPNNGCTWTGAGLDAIISDNCGTPSLSYSINGSGFVPGNANGYAFPVGTTNVTYRVIDGSGNVATCSFQIIVVGGTVSGNVAYYNVASTPMNNVQVNLLQNSVVIYSGTTDISGNYAISGVCPGTYAVAFVTSKPAGGVNATDAAQLNAWGVGPQYAIEKVRFIAGDVIGPDIINSTDAARVLTHFVTSGNPAFSSAWTFWNTNDMITNNVPQTTQLTLTVPTATSSITANFYALATGDFNRSFTPGSAKNASVIDGLTLAHEGIIEVYPDEIFMLPITAGIDMNISAISLILEFPADRLEIQGVYLGSDVNIPLEYAVIGNQLRIGWQSLIHLSALTGDAVVTLKVKNLTRIEENETLSFNLYPDTLNELADENYEVIYGAVLKVEDIKGNTVGTGDIAVTEKISLSGYPNPTDGKVTLTYALPASAKVTFEISHLMGGIIRKSGGLIMPAGEHTLNIDLTTLVHGIYAVTMKVEMADGVVQSKTIKVVKQ